VVLYKGFAIACPILVKTAIFFDCGNLVSKVREVLGILQPQPVKIKSS
jgi:hypothetical protein